MLCHLKVASDVRTDANFNMASYNIINSRWEPARPRDSEFGCNIDQEHHVNGTRLNRPSGTFEWQ
jgi:hypothetical protein